MGNNEAEYKCFPLEMEMYRVCVVSINLFIIVIFQLYIHSYFRKLMYPSFQPNLSIYLKYGHIEVNFKLVQERYRLPQQSSAVFLNVTMSHNPPQQDTRN